MGIFCLENNNSVIPLTSTESVIHDHLFLYDEYVVQTAQMLLLNEIYHNHNFL